MDGLAGYGSEDSENSSRSPRRRTMNKHQKATDAEPENSSAQLEAEWETFQKLISAEAAPDAPPNEAGSTVKSDGSSSDADSEDEAQKARKKRRSSSSSSGSSDKSDKSDKSGSESDSSDDSSNDDSDDEKKQKKDATTLKDKTKSPEPSAKRKSRSPSSSSESETEKKPAPSKTAGQPNGQPHTDSVHKERRPSRHSPSKRHGTRTRSRSPGRRRRSTDHRSRSRERKRRRRPRRSRSRGRRSRSRERRPRRRSRSRDKSANDKKDDKNSSRPRSLTRHDKRRSRSRSPKRRRRPRSRSHSRSRRRRRSPSRSPHRSNRRRRRRRRRRKRRPSGRASRSRSRSRSRSPSPVKKKRNEPLNYKEKLKQSLLQVQKQAAEGKLNLDELAANSKDLMSTNEKPSNLPLGSDNPLVAMAAGQLGHVTPQQALLQTMAAMHQKAQELTGVAVPKYYNPASVNPLKYAEQVQKRKLLWNKNKKEVKPESTEETAKPIAKTQWDGTLFSQDQDGKQTAKFRKLMGMKVGEGSAEGPAAGASSQPAEKEDDSNLRKQQELFSRLDQEYEFARMATHTHRGIGLGFSSMHHQYTNK